MKYQKKLLKVKSEENKEVIEIKGAFPRIEGEESFVLTADGYSEPVDGVVTFHIIKETLKSVES